MVRINGGAGMWVTARGFGIKKITRRGPGTKRWRCGAEALNVNYPIKFVQLRICSLIAYVLLLPRLKIKFLLEYDTLFENILLSVWRLRAVLATRRLTRFHSELIRSIKRMHPALGRDWGTAARVASPVETQMVPKKTVAFERTIESSQNGNWN